MAFDRKNYLDFLKGIAIFLVVFAHFDLYKPLKNFIYTFHMPLFMFLSGCTFFYSFTRHDIKTYKDLVHFIWNKIKSLLVPYIFIVFFLNLIFNYRLGIIYNLRNFIYDFKQLQSLWFLPVLFGIEIIFSFSLFIVYKRDNYNSYKPKILILEIAIILFLSCLLLFTSHFICFEIFRKMAIYLIPFFIGYAIEKYDIIKNICNSEIFCSIVIGISFLLVPHYDVDDKGVIILGIRLIVGCLISILVYKICSNKNINDYCNSFGGRCIQLIGKHTMAIYLFHPYFAHLFINKNITIIGISIAYYALVSVLVIISCIFIELIIIYSSNFFSFLVLGKNNINRENQ